MDKIIIILVGLLLVAVTALLFSLPVMLLWNWLMPIIFGLKTITWMQAFGLMLLSGMLFRSSSSSKSE